MISMAKKLLLTGATGFLGWHLAGQAPAGWQLVGTWHSSMEGIYPKLPSLPLELTDRDAIWRALKTVKPDAVMHLAAASSPAFCEANPDESQKINVDATAWLAEFCADLGSRLLFTSSSQVYDGQQPPCREVPDTSPINAYGEQKLVAEKAVLAIAPAAIVRVAVMYGMAGPTSNNFLQQWLTAWRKDEEVTAFYDEIRSFMSGSSAADGLFLLLEKGAEGIFNLGGGTAMSRYEFAEMAATIFDLPKAKIIRKSQLEVPSGKSRPADLTMDLTKIKDLGYQPEPALEGLKKLRDLGG